MDERKLGNIKQMKSFYQFQFTNGREKGKNCILVHNENLEVMFNQDNALDITYVRYKGNNISFLSKNGLNDGSNDFAENFEGGFLYTCGLDNVSGCVPNKKIHGSLHYTKAEEVNVYDMGEYLLISGKVRLSGLFLSNIMLRRNYRVYSNKIVVDDVVENIGFTKGNYVLLYHTNYGYPFLDECLKIEIPSYKSEPLTEIANQRKDDMTKITYPVDGGIEDVYYHYLKAGVIKLTNENLNTTITMKYDVEKFPVTLEWKSMISGDYALGIEPSLTRFDDFKMSSVDVGETKNYRIEILFE